MNKAWFAVFVGLLCLVHISYEQDTLSSSLVMSSPAFTSALTPSTAATATVAASTPVYSPSVTISPTVTLRPASTMPASSTGPTTTTSGMSPTATPTPTNDFKYRKDDDVCAHVTATMELAFKYESTRTKKTDTHYIAINKLSPAVDKSASVCDNKTVNVTLSFYNETGVDHDITFYFSKDDDKKYELKAIVVHLNLSDGTLFPDYDTSKHNGIVNGTTQEDDGVFSVDKEKSYYCKSTRKLTLKTSPDLGKKVLTLKLSHFQAQAFGFKNDTTGAFDKRTRCSLDQKSSKVVPIAVGAALAGLVVVVLIAYLIGRFRSRKQNSYEALS